MTETVAFLFSDLAGSTGLLSDLGADAYGEVLSAYRDAVEKAAAEHEGEVVDREGDGIFLVFPTAAGAIRAAADAQRSLTQADWPEGASVAARMGVHVGEAQRHEDGWVGLDIHRAARVGSAAHGGQVLVSETARVLAADTLEGDDLALRDLDEHRLKGLEGRVELHQLVGPGLPDDFPPLETAAAVPNNLPVQPTSFIGRERELAEVVDLVRDDRLVTLTGVGGAGKTRLALEVVSLVLGDHPDGVWLVELAPIADPDMVAHQLATALGVRADQDDGGRPVVELLVDHLEDRRTLVLLDNCEHVLDAAARLCDRLLRDCPHLTVVATSREGLGIPGEHLWQVPSLALPERDDRPDAVERSDAVRLFVERARAAVPSFSLDDGGRPLVVRICRRLDGIPLAIELAAARVRVLGVERLADRLDDRFRVLTGGSRTALPRQQTLAAAIDWSYELLDDHEATLFRRLAVFAGSFTLEAAEEICSGDGLDEADVLDLLPQLVDKSLVVTVEFGDGLRYRLLETLRAYARDRLTETDEAEVVRRRHRDHYAELADRVADHLHGPDRRTWFDRLATERDNLRAALDRSLAWGDGVEGAAVAAALGIHWRDAGHFQLAFTVLCSSLEQPDVPPDREAELRRQLAPALFNAGDHDTALAEAERAHAIVREGGPSALAVRTRLTYGELLRLHTRRDPMEAVAPVREAVTTARALGDRALEARTLISLGTALWWVGATDEAIDHLRTALAIALDLDDHATIMDSYNKLSGALEFRARRAEEARELAGKALAWFEETGGFDEHGRTSLRFFNWIAYTFLRTGEWDRVDEVLRETRRFHLEGAVEGWFHQVRGSLRWMRGELDGAAADATAALALGIDRWNHDLLPLDAEVAALHGRLDDVRATARAYVDTDVDEAEEAMKTAVLRPFVHAEVDAALGADGAEREEQVQAASRALEMIRELVARFPDPPPLQYELPATNLALAEAELSRVTGPDADLWRRAHDAAYYRYWQLYARWRLAEALVAVDEQDEAEAVLRETHAEAAEIGAGLIRDELEALADRTGVTLPRR